MQGHRGPSGLPFVGQWGTPSEVSATFSTCRCQNSTTPQSLVHRRGGQQTQESHGQEHREVSSVVPLLVWDSGRSRREPSAAPLRAPGGGVGAPPYPQQGRAQEGQRITPEPHGHDHCGPTGILGCRGAIEGFWYQKMRGYGPPRGYHVGGPIHTRVGGRPGIPPGFPGAPIRASRHLLQRSAHERSCPRVVFRHGRPEAPRCR